MPELVRLPEPNLYRAYGIYLLRSNHRLIRRLRRKHQPSIHGQRTWRASFILMDYLQHHPPSKNRRVMDLGCGWGPASVYCAKHFHSKVTGVDVDREVFPYLEVLSKINEVIVSPLERRFDQLRTARLLEENLIIGADVCFWDELVRQLQNLIARAIRGGVARIVIADPGRPGFYKLADYCEKRWDATLIEWYALEPMRTHGGVLEIRQRAHGKKND